MALRTLEEWTSWISDLDIDEDIAQKYASNLVESEITEDDLSELSHELLKEMSIIKPGHRTKILKKAKSMESSISTKVIKSDVKLPRISLNCSRSPTSSITFIVGGDVS